MKQIRNVACVLVAVLLTAQSAVYAQTPLGTAFSYQGQLKQAGAPVDGLADFQFRLWDAESGGNQVGSTVGLSYVEVANGLFTVQLDFGADVFDGTALWLEITVEFPSGESNWTTLSPRQPLNAAPYALYALDGPGSAGFWAANGADIYNTNSGKVGIGTNTPLASLQVINSSESHAIWAETGDIAVYAHRTGTSGTWPAVHGVCDSLTDGASGVRGVITSTDPGSESAGVYGINHGTGTADGYGVRGVHDGSGKGVYGYAPSAGGRGVEGHSESGTGVAGTSTDQIGVYGHSSNAYGGYFIGTDNTGSIATLCVQTGASKMLLDGDEIDSNWALRLNNNSTDDVYIANGGGNVGIGTSSPDARLHIDGGIDAEPNDGGYLVVGALDDLNLAFDNNEIMARSNGGTAMLSLNYDGGNVRLCGGAGGNVGIGVTPAARLDVAGNVIVRSESTGAVLIELGEGLDYAEGFDVSDKSQIQPGTVVVIDADNPGKLVVSETPYDRKVAGIVAGANGLGSAVRLGAGQFDFDVALAGRVYCNVDATYGAVQAGDLLTTSPTPGYAMKVADHNQAQGAILGKAMQPLKQGEKGQILVLVTLQ